MKIEIDCSKVEISHGEFREFLFQQYFSSQRFIIKLIVLLLFSVFTATLLDFSFDSRLLDNIFLICKVVVSALFTVWTFCPLKFFRFKKALEEYCKEGYDFSLSDSSFVVKGNRGEIAMEWGAVQKVRAKGGAIIIFSTYGNFLLSKSWLDAGEYGELKALLAAIGVKSNL